MPRKTLGAIVLCWAILGPVEAWSQTPICKAANDTSAQIISAVKAIMTPTNKVRLHANVRVAPAAEITLITNDSTCIRALDALNSYTFSGHPAPADPLPVYPIYVLRVGTYYATFDEEERAGEWHIIDFFDSSWNYVGSMLPF